MLDVRDTEAVQAWVDELEGSWPGLHVLNPKGEAPKSLTFKFDWLAAAGTMLLISGLLTALVLRVRPRDVAVGAVVAG